jgi:DNA-binding NarL/FixJ family response regulator
MEHDDEDYVREPARDNQSGRKPMISIGLVDEHSFTRECITRSLKEADHSLDTVPFKTFDDCLRDARDFDIIIFHVHQDIEHYKNSDKQIAFLTVLKELCIMAPVVILSAVDSPNLMAEAFESGARGYILTGSTNLELAIEIIRLVKAGGTFVPPTRWFLQRANQKDTTSRVTTNKQFTPRQMAVLDHLKLGKANKVIAYELAMSESTVKVHIRNIMKKMKATNRTEVACRAQTFLLSEGGIVGKGEVLQDEREDWVKQRGSVPIAFQSS